MLKQGIHRKPNPKENYESPIQRQCFSLSCGQTWKLSAEVLSLHVNRYRWVDKGVAQLISTESGIRIFKQRILILFKFNNYPPLPWVGLSDEVPEKPH
jgi:hypothetical protein